MDIREAREADLPAIIAIYNEAIPGRLATADTEPIRVESRRDWFREHTPSHRPLWVAEQDGVVIGWLSFGDFYGRPAYRGTAEISIYVAAQAQRGGIGQQLLQRAIDASPRLGVTTLLGFIFGHNAPSLALFRRFGFTEWGRLPRVAVLDGIERDLVIIGRQAL